MSDTGFTLTSPEIAPDGVYPVERTCDGDDASPELQWKNPPAGTRSFTLILDDPDAPGGTFTHWTLFNIPATVAGLAANKAEAGTPGENDFQRNGYGGPCPPKDHGPHRYYFKLYALDVESLPLQKGAAKSEIVEALQGHILGTAELMARYERQGER